MIRQQTWSPDTCQCVIVETWDDTTSNETRKHTFHSHETVCQAHHHLSGESVYKSVLEENRRKNTMAVVAKQIRDQFQHSHYEWKFDSERRLIAKIDGMTGQEKKLVQDACDIQFGVNKVEIL